MQQNNKMATFVMFDAPLQVAASILKASNQDHIHVIDNRENILGTLTVQNILSAVSEGRDMMAPVKNILEPNADNDFEQSLVADSAILHGTDNCLAGKESSEQGRSEDILKLYRNLSLELEAIINSTHNLIISIDRDGKIKMFNKSAEKFLGITAEEVFNKKIDDVFPESGLIKVAQTGRSQVMQKRVVKGKTFLSNRSPIVTKNQTIIGAVAVLQDISEFEQIASELKQVKALNLELDAIFESSFDGIWLADGNGKALKLNKANEKIFGLPRNQLVGKYPSDLLEEGVYSRSIILRAIERKDTVTATSTTKDGKTVIATSTPVFDDNDSISLVVTNIRDVTQIADLQSQLERMKGLTQLYQNKLQEVELKKEFIYQSNKMSEIVSLALRLAEVDCSVLITGPSGVGKELVADIIHSNSDRKEGPFIKVNCGAIPENLLESELFGYESGAFSGANRAGKLGFFTLAHKGTLLLDEIGELPLHMQVKLLRAVQDKNITRVGGTKPIKVDVRILAATNRNLEDMIANNEFRADLYYRLNVASISIPALNKRRDDIQPLVEHFLGLFNNKYHKNIKVTNDVIDFWCQFDWSGNVRHLENTIERVVITAQDQVVTTHDIVGDVKASSTTEGTEKNIPLRQAVERTERRLITRVFQQFKTTREMAKELDVHQSTLIRKAAKYGIKKQ